MLRTNISLLNICGFKQKKVLNRCSVEHIAQLGDELQVWMCRTLPITSPPEHAGIKDFIFGGVDVVSALLDHLVPLKRCCDISDLTVEFEKMQGWLFHLVLPCSVTTAQHTSTTLVYSVYRVCVVGHTHTLVFCWSPDKT